jgi:hypothetical protein
MIEADVIQKAASSSWVVVSGSIVSTIVILLLGMGRAGASIKGRV